MKLALALELREVDYCECSLCGRILRDDEMGIVGGEYYCPDCVDYVRQGW